MPLKFELFPFPVIKPYVGLIFEWRAMTVKVCDFCQTWSVYGDTNICARCREELEQIAVKLAGAAGPLTPERIRSLGFGLQPHQFIYGKPWREHLPPHERKRYGLHA